MIALINLVFAVIIFRRRKGRRYNVCYTLVVLFLFIWTFAHAIFHSDALVSNARLWVNIIYFSGAMIPTFFLMFAILFHTARRLSWGNIIVLLEPALLIGYLLFFTNAIVVEVIANQAFVLGPWYPLFVIHFTVYMLIAFYNLFKSRSRSSATTRLQMNYVIFGTLFAVIFAGFTNVFLPSIGVFHYQYLGPMSILIMVGIFVYAMRRYEYAWDFLARFNKASGFV